MKQLILASKSPRRKELLENCGIPFIVEAAEIDETLKKDVPLTEAIQDLSRRKASAILASHPEAVVLGS
ncbi:MAG: Maf family protein, partial [Solobacterium sp.]|nr:Maf family protein [Solobacterium sp.]